MTDPLRDLRDELNALRADVGLTDAKTVARLDRMEADIVRLEDDQRTFVARSWAMVVLVLTAAIGGLVAIITRAS